MLKDYFLEVKHYLSSYQDIWQREVLEQSPLPARLESWANELSDYNINQLLKLENDHELSKQHSEELTKLVSTIKNLESKLDKVDKVFFKGDKNKFRKVSDKKLHEMLTIEKIIDQSKLLPQNIIDFGGGVGHMCEYLSDKFKVDSLCFDRDEKLIKSGQQRIEKYNKEVIDKVKFKHARIEPNMSLSVAQKSLLIGLHACGSLSNYLIDFYLMNKNNSFINFGCCYHKHQDEDIFNLSNLAKKEELVLSKHSQTLAAKCNSTITPKLYEQRVMVKKFRYAFHFLLEKHFNKSEFIALGNYSKTLYRDGFVKYAQFFLEQLNLELNPQQIEDFYMNESLHKKINFLLKAGILRGLFGRLIEIYIVLDRALYLEQAGCQVRVVEAFEKTLSPRNIAIISSS
jgi:hypothetical protein